MPAEEHGYGSGHAHTHAHSHAGTGGNSTAPSAPPAAARYSCERFPSAAERFSVAPPPQPPVYCYQRDGSPPSPAPPCDRFVTPPAPQPTQQVSPERSPRRSRTHSALPSRYLATSTPVVSRYVPPSAHVPVERYVPRPSPSPAGGPYYCSERYSEPYRQYRPYQRARPPTRRCCPPPGNQNGGSPSMLPPERFQREYSSSPLLNHADEHARYGREFATQMEGGGYVEYVGGSGGRHVSCTPPGARLPPDPPCCLQARRCAPPALNWRPVATMSNNMGGGGQPNPSPAPGPGQSQPSINLPPTQGPPQMISNPPPRISSPPPSPQQEQPQHRGLERSMSRKDKIKKYVKRETALFFGVEEDQQDQQKELWQDRRLRLAERRYGPLRVDNEHDVEIRYRGGAGGVYGASGSAPREPRGARLPDVLPASSTTGVGVGDQQARAVSAPLPLVAAAPPTPDARQRRSVKPLRRKDSVVQMTFHGISYVVTTLSKHKPRSKIGEKQKSRSYHPSLGADDDSDVSGDHTDGQDRPPGLEDEEFFAPEAEEDSTDGRPILRTPRRVSISADDGEGAAAAPAAWVRTSRPQEVVPQAPPVGEGRRIAAPLLDRLADNSDRRQYGMGVTGKTLGSFRKSVVTQANVKKQLNDMRDYRPYFTYWVSAAQTLILIASLFCYGFGPVGLDRTRKSGQVLVTSLSLQQVEYHEPANFWLGPKAADLIHLGAKFAPCMRRDSKILREVSQGHQRERDTACCIRNDDSGCVQSSKADCSVRGLRPTMTNTISTWKKWSAGDSGPGGRISGSVCGLDPKFCDAPASVAPYEWPDDITKWPICRKPHGFPRRHRDKTAEHMACEVIGHPCCIGVNAACRITTREYCDFVGGHFHEEASLCSQVSCLDDVCGMLPFVSPGRPDQFYRLWTSIFLHAGVVHLLTTLVLQWFIMRDLEKLAGPLRIGIVYLGSGMAGNLASAIFVPYRAEVGPAGAHFGLLACLMVEVLSAWPILKRPHRALARLLIIAGFLLLIGVLPWIDNYSHLFGLVFGFLLSYALLPFITFGPYDRQRKVALVWACLAGASLLFAVLVILFYVVPVYDCEICTYFTCLPFTKDFCSSQNIDFKREEAAV